MVVNDGYAVQATGPNYSQKLCIEGCTIAIQTNRNLITSFSHFLISNE